MKILDKIAFVVCAVLALASVAGCSVEVLPSPEKDGGRTAPGDDAPDDGLTGADGNGGVGGDGSTTVDDVNEDDSPCGRMCDKLVSCGLVTAGAERETCKDLCRAGAQPDSVYQCFLDHECNELAEACPTPGTDGGGGQVNEDGGTTVTVDENGNAVLPDCDETPVRGSALYFEFTLEILAGSGYLVEVEFNGFIWRMGQEPEPNEEVPPDRIIGEGRSFPDPPMEIPPGHGLVRISNYSDHPIELRWFEVYSSREERMNSALPLWSRAYGYPFIGPHQAVTLGELEGGETEDSYDPLCALHLENLEE